MSNPWQRFVLVGAHEAIGIERIPSYADQPFPRPSHNPSTARDHYRTSSVTLLVIPTTSANIQQISLLLQHQATKFSPQRLSACKHITLYSIGGCGVTLTLSMSLRFCFRVHCFQVLYTRGQSYCSTVCSSRINLIDRPFSHQRQGLSHIVRMT